jgi:hypothetical protein
MLSNLGEPAIPGVLSFSTAMHEKISLDAGRGTAKLLGNHYKAIALSVVACAAVAKLETAASLDVFANLAPAVAGDADLGATVGPPVVSQTKGKKFIVPVRLNTGGKTLSFF